ncbi:rhodanese domain-containing protein CG4456 isoform X2 [Drosophila elegans]|uniref:rhodanese domain-containing protein CG4456 isoform X1 n=1 Tax=Drosophila elegans TaxID=30023 RepID=UPI0007E77BFE|nr:rhodanese domain-containing protein CG4456 isoform X1 [Drosophila elegans]XP_017113509.1 rhodanese domain-containing protein CG4456 isoform X2 [Drosophila elegans]
MLIRHCMMALRAARSPNLVNTTRSPHNMFLQRFYSSQAPAIGIVDYDVVKKLPSEPQKLLIDVREPEELKETGQIPASINIPLGVVSQELTASDQLFKSKYGREKPQPDTEIIFHCKIGKRSLKAAEAATALGFRNVKNYEGSWLDWAKREGLPK